MTSDERLAELFVELRGLGIPCLVMGGHAVRFHGVDRSTLDYDLALAMDPDEWNDLPRRLQASRLLAKCREGDSWRPKDFRRFVIGSLPDGRDERLECWRRNHLLASFADLESRRAEGMYGGRVVAFLGIDDLIRSKETEREDDWRDLRLLEEIADERRLGRASKDSVHEVLESLRSHRGFERALASGMLENRSIVIEAYRASRCELALAFLRPYAPDAEHSINVGAAIERVLDGPLRRVVGGSVRHRALVEAVRRLYLAQRMAEDRADKARAIG